MTIKPLDRSNYFKALLVLVGHDRNLTVSRRKMLKKVANVLGFNQNFTTKAIKDFFRNSDFFNKCDRR